MVYNIVRNGKVIKETELPEGLSKSQIRCGAKKLCKELFNLHFPYVKVDKMKNKNSYIVMSNRGKLLFTLEEKLSVWKRFRRYFV